MAEVYTKQRSRSMQVGGRAGWSLIRESLQRISQTDHEGRTDTVRIRNHVPYNAAYYGHTVNYTVIG